MQTLLIVLGMAVTAASLATLGGIAVHIYGKVTENARRKEIEAEYVRVHQILKKASVEGNTVLSCKCRDWLQNYKRGIHAPFPHP